MSLALDTAINGQGVVLSLEPLAMDDIVAGRLVVPFGPRMPPQHAYYLVSHEESANRSTLGAFRAWLLDEAQQARARHT
jgi:LysR family transcriptional regulator, glycine cleavage system transcriptional activator